MPIRINGWKCKYKFCGKFFKNKKDCLIHENTKCKYNPITKHCETCNNEIQEYGNYYCAKASNPKIYDIWDENLGNCPEWKLKTTKQIKVKKQQIK